MMGTWLVAVITAFVLLFVGRKAWPRDAAYEVIEEDPCETCLRWEECNGVDDGCPLKNKG